MSKKTQDRKTTNTKESSMQDDKTQLKNNKGTTRGDT